MLNTAKQGAAASPGRSRYILLTLAALAIAAIAIPRLWMTIDQIVNLLRYPYPHDGLEGTLLHNVQLLWRGEPLYQPLERYRFISTPYPPLHPLLLSFTERWQGMHVFWSGRIVSTVSLVFAATFVALHIYHVSRSRTGALIGAIVFSSFPPVILWATRVKPDLFALVWTTLGLYVAARALGQNAADGRPHKSAPYLPLAAAVCFTLAFFTKHTAIAAPTAVGVAFLIDDVRRWFAGERQGYIRQLPLSWRTLAFGLTYAGLVGATWLLIDVLTQTQFSFHILVMHRDAAWSRHLMNKFLQLLVPHWPLMVLAIVVVAQAVQNRSALVAASYIVIVPFTLIGAGKTGANHNHLLETMLGLSLAGGIALGWAMHELARARIRAIPIVALLALQLVLSFQPHQWFTGELTPHGTPERFVSFIQHTPGEILADNPALLYLAGKPMRYNDPSSMGPVVVVGLWDQSGLLEDIAQHRFSAILIPIDVEKETLDPSARWTPEMLSAIRDHYRVLFRDSIFVYAPK